MTPIYILICLALVGCKDDDYKSQGTVQEIKTKEHLIDFTVPVDVNGEVLCHRSRDTLPQMKGIDTKLFMIAEKLERIALALERK